MDFFEKGKKAAVAVIVTGSIFLLMGLIGLVWVALEGTAYVESGINAYTILQNAVADTANNVAISCSIIVSVMGCITLLFGVLFLNYIEIKKSEYDESNKKHVELLKALNATNCTDITDIQSTSDEVANMDKKSEEETDCQQYICSICKSPIAYGATKCDNCGVSIDWNLL